MPSSEEAFGLTAQEATGSGTVVAGFKSGGIPEIVEEGLNGLLVEPGDVDGLIKVTRRLLGDIEFRNRWAAQATIWCNKKFCNSKMVSEHLSFYEQLKGQVK